jgi:RimJ/RimL family protein N-acetyltransferase
MINPIFDTTQVGLMIGEEKYRGKGYGTLMLMHILDYSFNTLKKHVVELHTYKNNKIAIKLFKKLGFNHIIYVYV